MNYSGLGDQQGARDWLTFAYEWKFRKPEERKIEFITTMTDDAVALAGLPRGWNPGDLTQEQYVDVYSRLIAKHPRLSWLHHLRGTHHAAIKQFEKAAADYAEAVDCIEAIEPARDDLRHWEALAAVCLYNGDVSRAEATCKRAISRSWSITSTQPLLALMCCYLPSGSLEYDKFYRAVRMAYNNDRATHYISHLRLYTAYRGRGFDEVLTAMQEIGNRPEPELWLFTAMAHERLGSHVLARDALNEARNRIELQEQRSPQVVTSWADKPVHWCQCQALLREAEALIEPGKATSKGQVTGQEKAGTPSSSASAQASKS
jgi:tetratricopeptide (TPR) repeat protein